MDDEKQMDRVQKIPLTELVPFKDHPFKVVEDESMVFYAHLLQEALDSPTIVVMTDRIDLDDQLYTQIMLKSLTPCLQVMRSMM